MVDYPRKKSTVACDVCRKRRTKCDGQKPKCGFCQSHDANCIYHAPPEPAPSRLELDLAGIRQQLDHLTALVTSSNRGGQHHQSRHSTAALDAASPFTQVSRDFPANRTSETGKDDDPGFPVMVIKRQAMMVVLGLEQDTAAWLAYVERSQLAQPSHSLSRGSRMFLLESQRVTSALSAFSERIHIWLPVFASGFTDAFTQSANGQSSTSSDRCLVMLVMAVGLFAEVDSPTMARERRLDAPYLAEAAALLSEVMLEFTVGSLQCLILFAVHSMCLLRPYQAHDFVVMASFRVQNMLRSHFFGADGERAEALRRAYWSILLLESELRVQLDLPDSGIWILEDEVPLPSADETWYFQPAADVSSAPPPTQAPENEATQVYLLAEVAMRRMLQRCTTSVSKSAGGSLRYAPIVAVELELQLDEWYQYLPLCLKFPSQNTSTEDVASPTTQFLQAQYFACKASIYWPAVYQAIELGQADDELLQHCAAFFDAYVSFAVAATASLRMCLPFTWTLTASIFIISMAALKASETECLQQIINPAVQRSYAVTLGAFEEVAEHSPSLAALANIMRERLNTNRTSDEPKAASDIHRHGLSIL